MRHIYVGLVLTLTGKPEPEPEKSTFLWLLAQPKVVPCSAGGGFFGTPSFCSK